MNTHLEFDADLLRRYDRPGPRYTSYPTAPQFSPASTTRDFRREAARSNEDPIPRDLSLYVHVPFCLTPVLLLRLQPHHHPRRARAARPTLERLYREIELVAPLFDRDREVDPAALRRRHAELPRRRAAARAGRESAPSFPLLDARRPRFLDRARSALRARRRHRGATRPSASTAPASACRISIRPCRRRSTASRASRKRCASSTPAAAHGFRSVNVDLIYGLPKQTLDGFRAHARHRRRTRGPTASRSTATRTCRRCSRRSGRSTRADLPDAAERARAAAAGDRTPDGRRLRLHRHGPLRAARRRPRARAGAPAACTAISWATPRTPTCDLVGLGVSAISHIGDSFSQNPRDLPAGKPRSTQGRLPVLRAACASTRTTCCARDLIQQLMCQGVHRPRAIERRYAIDFDCVFRRCARATAAAGRRRPGRASTAHASSPPRAAGCCCVSSPCASTATSTSPAVAETLPRHLARDLSRARRRGARS